MPYILYKRDNGINDDPHSFNSIMLRKLNDDITDENMIDPNDTPSSLLPKLNDMVQAMVMAEPTSYWGTRFISHSAFPAWPQAGWALEQFNQKGSTNDRPTQIDSDYWRRADVHRRQAGWRTLWHGLRPEDDIDFRRDWQTITDVKHSLALSSTTKSMASLTPTSTEVGSSSVSDDSAEAVRQLQEMADKQRRTFTQVFEDPANRALANCTYTKHHLPGSA
jgi:hypothetical protein